VLLEEIEHIHAAGQNIRFETLTGDQAREIEPSLSPAIGAAIRLHDQRFLNPSEYVAALAKSVTDRGGRIVSGVNVGQLRERNGKVIVAQQAYDAAVIASGAWLNDLARPFGVRLPVQAGRGYSFTVPMERVPSGPVYFPAQRVACTPVGDRLRVAGMMEFRPADANLDTRRIEAIVDAARPLLRGADLDSRQDEWVGARPCTPDGLPLIGPTRSERVFVAGGHGMWGITLGPITGRLLAETITARALPLELLPFDPLRTARRAARS
jgi:D-amino-acid dehydrogenase